MKSLIDIMRRALPCPLDANRTSDFGECATYDFNTTTYNGSMRRVRMKTQIFAATMERGLEIQNILDSAIVTMGDDGLTETITGCARNGGGWLNDGDRHVRIAYYDITMRA